MWNEILEKLGLKYEDLLPAEQETMNSWLQALQKNEVTLDSVKRYISVMRDSVEQELATTGHNSKQDLFLKARLRNFMLIEAFLATPEKAKAALERSLAGLVQSKKI